MATSYITKVYLLDVPLENDYKNTLYFTSKANQQTYFQSTIVKSYTDFSYQRKDKLIRIPDIYDNIYNCNYVMYQNSNYSNKWFYAFITKMEYVNDGLTNVYIETDVMQTWAFDYTVKSSFVEREHVSDDTIGLHTQPENVELGEYVNVQNETGTNFAEATNCYVCIATTSNYDTQAGSRQISYYNSMFSGLIYYIFKDYLSVNVWLLKMDTAGKGEAIQSIFMVPKSFFGEITWEQVDDWVGTYYRWVPVSNGAYNLGDFTMNKPSTLNNYTPVNNKLLTFPYCYLLGSNNNGTDVIYKYEDFSSNNIVFKIIGAISPGCSIKLLPRDYKNDNVNYIEALNCGKLPTCAWTTDVYINWLTEQAVNMPIQGLNAGIQLGSGNYLGAAESIANSISQIYQHSLIPPQAKGNTNSSDVCFAYDKNDPTFYYMSIKEEYARIIDKYFDMFGYKVNMVKVPNKAHRSRWWYTKTININIDGAIPDEDMQKIKNVYNNGITFWKNASEIENYSLSNSIV